jgi:hypothetical protein
MYDLIDELSIDKSISINIGNIQSFNENFPLFNDLFLFPFPLNDQNLDADKNFSLSTTAKKKLSSSRKRKHQFIGGVKIHDKNAPDNILRKIQVHYITFIIDTVNELLQKLGYGEKFIDINYNEKKNITKNNFSSLKNLNIGQILCKKVSSKFRKQFKQNSFKNNVVFDIVKTNKYVNIFLSQNYIKLFKDVYYQDKRDIIIDDLYFRLSENVKTYKNLLSEKFDEADAEEYKTKVNEVIHKYYFKIYFKVQKI